MSGSPSQLLEGVLPRVDDPAERAVLGPALAFLLQKQYVTMGQDPRLWRVTRGSGMGLRHSSSVADLCYATAPETWSRRVGVRRAFGIYWYRRFRDDIMILSDRPGKMAVFFELLRSRALPVFTLELKQTSDTEIEMLAFRVFREGNKLHCEPKAKPLAAPLTVDSAHPDQVHAGWPRAYIDTLARWCSRPQDVTKHRAAFHERLAWFHSPPWVHARAADGAVRRERGPEPRRGGQPGDGTGSANAHLEACRLWFVVDFHRSLQNGAVTRALRELSTDSRWMGAFGFAFGLAPRLCISWRLRVRRAASWLRAASALEDTELQ